MQARAETQESDRAMLGPSWTETGLVFTTRTGRPVEPRNLYRSFRRICSSNGIRPIPVHAVRHSTASLLKRLKVPPKDAQVILGHAHITTTQQIYTHVDEVARRDAVTKLNALLGGAGDCPRLSQLTTQMGRFLADELAAGRLGDDTGPRSCRPGRPGR